MRVSGVATLPRRVLAPCCLGSAHIVVALCSTQRLFACLTRTRPLQKDVRRHDYGDARRLTFDERAERRSGKTRELRETREQRAQEAQTIVDDDFPAELEAIYAQVLEKANVSAMKVMNMSKCLELLSVPVSATHTVALGKLAQVVKVSPTLLEVTVSNAASFAAPVLQCINRFDSNLHVQREGNKLRVTLPAMTTARRDKAVNEITTLAAQLRERVKQARMQSSKAVHACGIDDSVAAALTQQLDDAAKSFVEDKVVELNELSEQVMSMGEDESDSAVQDA